MEELTTIIQTAESRPAKTIREVFESRLPLTYIRSAEEQRIGTVLSEVASRMHAAGPIRSSSGL